MQQQSISVQDYIIIIGKQQVRIEVLQTQLAQADAKIKELTPPEPKPEEQKAD